MYNRQRQEISPRRCPVGHDAPQRPGFQPCTGGGHRTWMCTECDAECHDWDCKCGALPLAFYAYADLALAVAFPTYEDMKAGKGIDRPWDPSSYPPLFPELADAFGTDDAGGLQR